MVDIIKFAALLNMDIDILQKAYEGMNMEQQLRFQASAKLVLEVQEAAAKWVTAVSALGVAIAKPIPKYKPGAPIPPPDRYLREGEIPKAIPKRPDSGTTSRQ